MIRLNVVREQDTHHLQVGTEHDHGGEGLIKVHRGRPWFNRSVTLQCLIPVQSHDFARIFGNQPESLELNRGSVVKYLNTRLGPDEQLWHFAGFIGSSDAAIAAAWNRFANIQIETDRVKGDDCRCLFYEYPSKEFRFLYDEAVSDSSSNYLPSDRQVIGFVKTDEDEIKFKAWRVHEKCQLILYVDATSCDRSEDPTRWLRDLLGTIALQPGERVREIRLYWTRPVFGGGQIDLFRRILEDWKREIFPNGRKKASD